MIPWLVTYRQRRRDGRWLRLYVPVLPILPVVLVAGVVACLVFRIGPMGALRGAGRVLWALPGARIGIDDGRTAFEIRVS